MQTSKFIRVAINKLPDDALLETLGQYVDDQFNGDDDARRSLVHVCQRWRCVA